MVSLPYESLIGISYGLLTSFVPALVIGVIAIGVAITQERSLPVLAGLVVIPVSIGTGVYVGIFDPSAGFSQAQRLAMASVVAGLLGLVATSQGNRIASELPKDRTLPIVRGKALSADAIDSVDAMGQVTIRPTGAIREFEGYPPLSPALRTALEDGAWRFPADLQLAELERRLEQRLRTEYDLSQVDVSVDGRGRATIAAAPPAKGVATTIPDGSRAVTVTGLLPTGIEPGDSIAISADGETIQGEVLAIGGEADTTDTGNEDIASPSDDRRCADAGFDGGEGRATVVVKTTDAGKLLDASQHRIEVLPSGDNHAFEAAALLEDAGQPVTAVKLTDDDSVEPETALGVCSDGQWRFADDRTAPDTLTRAFVAGSPREVSEQ
ncbi:hypothetical protein [Halopiger djelfimassiliensis]|uniref:hypothetical protein n=1 Tax=Halopiger djelfimassiliensis TaxID=1293047 RepID=UPI000677AF89|nr:hypothetical protein [Halopiger djelfimassiliensis]